MPPWYSPGEVSCRLRSAPEPSPFTHAPNAVRFAPMSSPGKSNARRARAHAPLRGAELLDAESLNVRPCSLSAHAGSNDTFTPGADAACIFAKESAPASVRPVDSAPGA